MQGYSKPTTAARQEENSQNDFNNTTRQITAQNDRLSMWQLRLRKPVLSRRLTCGTDDIHTSFIFVFSLSTNKNQVRAKPVFDFLRQTWPSRAQPQGPALCLVLGFHRREEGPL